MADWTSDATFQSVCELLKEKHDKPGAIKNACRKIDECLVCNKYARAALNETITRLCGKTADSMILCQQGQLAGLL